MTRQEVEKLLEQADVPLQQLARELCGQRRPDKETLEVAGRPSTEDGAK